MTQTVYFLSLGCSKNRVDTEVMLGVSDALEYRVTSDPENADVIVVNTCGFIESAKAESIEATLELASYKEGRCKKLVMAGCLAQRYAADLAKEMPEVDHFLGSSDMMRLKEVLEPPAPGRSVERHLVGNPADYLMRASDPRRLSLRPHSAYLKIAEGCNRSCSFCAIPSIRGKQRSRPIDDVVREAEMLAEGGTREINLISQDTVSYGRDQGMRGALTELLRRLGEVDDLRWIRVHYLYPESITEELIELFAEHPKVLPYIDMPLQHISDRVLTRMRRGHGGDRIYKLTARMRERIPGLSFRTTFITGHPGESDADFEELCAFVRDQAFDHMGVFAYSDEEGTRSAELDDHVQEEVASERQQILMGIQRDISRAKLRALVGQELEVMVDGESDESELLLDGRLWFQAPDVDGKVVLCNGSAAPGEMLPVTITDSGDYDLVGDLESAGAHPRGPAKARRKHLRVV